MKRNQIAHEARVAVFRGPGIAIALLIVMFVVLFTVTRIASAVPPTVCFGQNTNDNRSTDGDDYLSGTEDADVAALGDGNDQYFSGDGPDSLCGNGGDDVIVGEGGADSLSGGAGDDVMNGLGGGDVLLGGPGADTLVGNGGGDVLRAGAEGDRDDIYDGLGSDIITGGDEDVWHRCADDATDDHSGFSGIIIPDPDC